MFGETPTSRTPPHSMAAELAVLGGVILANDRIRDCASLVPTDFYSTRHRLVWSAMIAMRAASVPIDTVTLGVYLDGKGELGKAGGHEGLLALTNVVPTVQNIAEHAEIIRRKSIERQALTLAHATVSALYGGADVETTARDLASARELLLSATDSGLAAEWQTLGQRGRWLEEAPAPRTWLLKRGETPVLGHAEKTVGLLVAPGGRGKSYCLCDLAISIATGTPWLGAFNVAMPGPVVLALAEETTEEIRRRLYAVAVQRRMTAEECELAYERIVPLGLKGRRVSLGRVEGTTVTATAMHADLVRRLGERPYAAVLLDPMTRWVGGMESDNDLATQGIQLLEQIAEAAQATVIVAHHTAKWSRRDGEGSHGSSARGVSAITDGARWQAELQGKSEDDLTLAVTKSNGAPPCEPVRLVREPSGAIRAMTEAELAAADRGEPAANSVTEDAKRLVYALRTAVEPVMGQRGLRNLLSGRNERRAAAIKHAAEQEWIASDARGQYFVTDKAGDVSRDGDEWGG